MAATRFIKGIYRVHPFLLMLAFSEASIASDETTNYGCPKLGREDVELSAPHEIVIASWIASLMKCPITSLSKAKVDLIRHLGQPVDVKKLASALSSLSEYRGSNSAFIKIFEGQEIRRTSSTTFMLRNTKYTINICVSSSGMPIEKYTVIIYNKSL